MKCKTATCKNDSGDFKHCKACRNRMRENQKRFLGQLPPTIHRCQVEGCGVEIPPRFKFCNEHSKQRNAASREKSNAARYTKPKVVNSLEESKRMQKRRESLNPQLLALRMCQGALSMMEGAA